ncbi:N-acetyltransferase [Saxibacter everestensis]|uniref:N-acetyltransferase n=1 Tax=Saxibacter everestensis TaxID=2909229 RepID=A0ABY8QXF3_9MICO|nr:N-acetyltransferase [Brevibacteriaceae bacterium ZFBP1038]
MLIRREQPADRTEILALIGSAFKSEARDGELPVEVPLTEALFASADYIPELSLVAEATAMGTHAAQAGRLLGHVICTRGWIETQPALGLGPLAVLPEFQKSGVGSALMYAVLGAADAMGEGAVVLLGHRDYYPRFGFRPAGQLGIEPPVPEWEDHFQVRTLREYSPDLRGAFHYSQPFNELS